MCVCVRAGVRVRVCVCVWVLHLIKMNIFFLVFASLPFSKMKIVQFC